MGWIIGKGIGVPFRLGGSGLGSSYWTQLNKPSNITTAIITGGVRISWTDNTGGKAAYQVWVTDNGVKYTQVGTNTANGATYLDHVTASPIPLTYKVRGVNHGYYSDYTDVVTQKLTLAYYPLNRHYTTGDGNVKDYSGNNYGLTNTSGTSKVANKNGIIYSAISFDGTNEGVLKNIAQLCLSGPMTFCSWFKTASDLTTQQVIISSVNGTGGDQNYYLDFGATDKRLRLLWGGAVVATSNTDLEINKQYHVAFVRSGSSGAWTGTLYLDGHADGSGNTATNPSDKTTNNVALGSRSDGTTSELIGTLDDVRFYDRALTADEILAIKNYTVEDKYHVFKQTTYTEISLASLRTTILSRIFTSGLPTGGAKTITEGVADPLTTSPLNLASVDKVVIEVTGIADRECYTWHPTNPNGKFAIVHYAHVMDRDERFEASGIGDLTRELVEAGITCCGIPMPPGIAEESTTHDGLGYDSVDDLAIFLTGAWKILNEYENQFDELYITGHSGGGWTSEFMGALDTRLTKIASNAGSLAYYATQYASVARDFEQQLIGLTDVVEYPDIYLMCCTGGRLFKKYINNGEFNFNETIYNYDPFDDAINSITDNFEFNIETNALHTISDSARTKIVTFFSN